MKRFITLVLSIALMAFSAMPTFAADNSYGDVNCQPIYGGGETCESTNRFVLDKKVLDPSTTSTYVDNLTVNDSKYMANQIIKFQLTIKNTGNTSLNELTLTDIMPSYVKFISGPGNYNSNNNTLTFKVLNLNPNETRVFVIEGKIVDTSALGQGTICNVVNQASLIFGNDESRDNSQFCIQNSGKTIAVLSTPSIKQTPATGPEMFSLLGLIPAGLSGLILRKKASK